MPVSKRSFFVVIEGIDFSGKTTLLEKLKEVLKDDEIINNYFEEIIYTKEPNEHACDFCHQLRQIAICNPDISDLTRALIFFANRSEHIRRIVKPAIEAGRRLIICDRFYLSTLVFQTKGGPELMNWVKYTQHMIYPKSPDITYFIEISKELFIERYQSSKNRAKNYMDTKAFETFDEVTRLYKHFIDNKEEYNLGEVRFLNGNENETNPIVFKVQKDLQNLAKGLLSGKN